MISGGGALKKTQRVGSGGRLCAEIDSSYDGGDLPECSHKQITLRRSPSLSLLPVASTVAGGFNDSVTADVILRLIPDQNEVPPDFVSSMEQSEIQIYLHSNVLRRSKYFAALLSDRWQQLSGSASDNSKTSSKFHRFKLHVPATSESVNQYLTVLKLHYTDDVLSSVQSVNTALDLLPVALELLFEDCIKACVRFLEAVPWTEEEEKKVLSLVPLMSDDEAKELLERMYPVKSDLSEEMLHGLILSAIHNHPNMCFAKAFVAKLLREFSSKESARRVLDKAFEKSLRVVKQSLEEYSSPDFRGDHNETEAIQRLNLHTAMTNGKHLLWLVERMIELKVADTAVKIWSEQSSLTADLQRAFRDDSWRNIVPSLPAVVLRCTSKLANAVASGNILANRQVRMKLVKEWLPVLIICKDGVLPIGGPSNKSLYSELEETFLGIISTLSLSTAQELLLQCLSFSTRNVDDCPHLVSAFTTWFRRANLPAIDGLL